LIIDDTCLYTYMYISNIVTVDYVYPLEGPPLNLENVSFGDSDLSSVENPIFTGFLSKLGQTECGFVSNVLIYLHWLSTLRFQK